MPWLYIDATLRETVIVNSVITILFCFGLTKIFYNAWPLIIYIYSQFDIEDRRLHLKSSIYRRLTLMENPKMPNYKKAIEKWICTRSAVMMTDNTSLRSYISPMLPTLCMSYVKWQISRWKVLLTFGGQINDTCR